MSETTPKDIFQKSSELYSTARKAAQDNQLYSPRPAFLLPTREIYSYDSLETRPLALHLTASQAFDNPGDGIARLARKVTRDVVHNDTDTPIITTHITNGIHVPIEFTASRGRTARAGELATTQGDYMVSYTNLNSAESLKMPPRHILNTLFDTSPDDFMLGASTRKRSTMESNFHSLRTGLRYLAALPEPKPLDNTHYVFNIGDSFSATLSGYTQADHEMIKLVISDHGEALRPLDSPTLLEVIAISEPSTHATYTMAHEVYDDKYGMYADGRRYLTETQETGLFRQVMTQLVLADKGEVRSFQAWKNLSRVHVAEAHRTLAGADTKIDLSQLALVNAMA